MFLLLHQPFLMEWELQNARKSPSMEIQQLKKLSPLLHIFYANINSAGWSLFMHILSGKDYN